MQLHTLVLYSHDGRQRHLPFKVGGLNVITGESGTGKTQLLEIIEFCLGRETIRLATGPLSDAVAWYGLLVQLESGQAFIGRPVPPLGQQSSTRAMLVLGDEIEIPVASALVANSDAFSVRTELGRRIGIADNLTEPPPTSTRLAIRASLAHALLLCFQDQNEIDDRAALFHRQGEDFVGQAIQDTLPYFLGASDPEQMELRAELRQARRNLRRVQRDLTTVQSVRERADRQTLALLERAHQAQLIELTTTPDPDAARELLVRAASITGTPPALPSGSAQRYRDLMRERREVRENLRRLEVDIALLREQQTDQGAYEEELREQHSRLATVGLFASNGHDVQTCPLCSSVLASPDPSVAEIQRMVEQLRQRVGALDAAGPVQHEAIADLETRAANHRDRLGEIATALNELAQADIAVQRFASLAEERAYLRGRIEQFSEGRSISTDERLATLIEDARVAGALVDELAARLDAESQRDETRARLNLVADNLTEWARELALEHSEYRVLIDLDRLNVIAETPRGIVGLDRIGSASNWVGYHLVAHLALHAWFAAQARPVPRFVIFDQPSSPYYPEDQADQEEPANDTDRQAVRRMFRLLHDVAVEQEGQLQVIVCDHANLRREQWFQEAIVENWRDGLKLVPTDWSPRP